MGGAAVPLAELPAYVPNAFIAIEDRRFYSHFGIDPIGIFRAIVRDILRRGASQGGSTLTQQLAKNLFLTQQRTLSRKVQEAMLALWLEHNTRRSRFSSSISTASISAPALTASRARRSAIFGKSARKLTLAEAAMLAGLVQSPSRLAPQPQSRRRRAPRRRRAQRYAGAENDLGRCRESGAGASGAGGAAVRRRLGQLRRRLGHGCGRRSDRHLRSGYRGADHDRSEPAERGRTGARRHADPEGRQVQHFARRAGGDDARRRGARAGRRTQLRREPIQPRRRRQAPARLARSSPSSISPRSNAG